MKFIKFLLFLLAIGVGIWLFFGLIGFVSTILWYLFWIGLFGIGGYAGYKLFLEKEKKTPQLEEGTPIGISELDNAERELEEYRRKYLPK